MTLKAAVAELSLGGGKGVIAAEPDSPPDAYHRRLALRDFAELVESFGGQYITAQDAGTREEDISYMARFTDHVSGRPRGFRTLTPGIGSRSSTRMEHRCSIRPRGSPT